MRGALPRRSCMADSAATGMELPAAHRTGTRARRREDRAGEAEALARVKKKAKNEGRTIVFIDESGLSQRPHRCRTCAATRTDAGAAISLQLEDAVGDGGRDLVELLFSPLSQHDSQPAGDRVPHPPATPSARQAADRLGWPAESPQPNGVGLRAPAARALVVGVSAGLRSGTEPGRVPVGALEAP